MSKTNDTPTADEQTETARYEKDVMLTFYGHADYEDERAFLDDVFGDHIDIDVDATTQSTDEVVELEFSLTATDDKDFERTISSKVSPWSDRDKEALRNAIQSGQIDVDAVDWLDATIEEHTETVHDHDLGDILDTYLEDYFEGEQTADLRDMLADYDYEEKRYSIYAAEYEAEFDAVGPDASPDDTEVFRVQVSANGRDVDRRRVLVHQDNRTADNRFVEPDLLPEAQPYSGQIVVTVEAPTQLRLDKVSGELIPGLYAELGYLDAVESVRLTDCETMTIEQGECYNI
jgi:hypothetical protein